MRDGRSIGVLSPFVGGDYYGAVIAGVHRAARAAGDRVLALQTLDPGSRAADYAGVPEYRRPIAWRHLDAAVVLPGAVDADYVRALRRSGRPVILVSHEQAGVDCPRIGPDNALGVREAVDHLVAHGHERIAFAGNLKVTDVAERLAGYREALADHGLPAPPDLVFAAPDNHESGGVAVAAALVHAGMPATAVVLGTDRNAIGLVQHLAAAGYTLPDDLAVVGFDDIADGRFAVPSLSTVSQSLELLGGTAYGIVRDADPTAPGGAMHRVPTRFVRRDSCGCPPEGLRLSESEARSQYRDTTYLQMTLNTQYELGVELLGPHEHDPRDLRWLARTPARAGCLGLWPTAQDASAVRGSVIVVQAAVADDTDDEAGEAAPDDAAADDAGEPIVVVGMHHADGLPLPGLGSIMPVGAFPPPALFDAADASADEIVFVVPVRSDTHDWGVLCAIGTIQDTTPPGREMVNHSGSMLAVSLDHGAVLQSLHEQRERLRRAALHDQLTGLPNRALLLDRMRRAGQRAARAPGHRYAVLFLDLNGFKAVNDTYGHEAGDRLLVHVANSLNRLLRASDTAARLGGDEFVVLLDGLPDAEALARVVARIHRELSAPVDIGGQEVQISVSIGVAPSDHGDPDDPADPADHDPERLLRRADAAMYRQKTALRVTAPLS